MWLFYGQLYNIAISKLMLYKNKIHKTKVFIFFYFYREPFSLRMINFRHINDLIKIKTLTIFLNTIYEQKEKRVPVYTLHANDN